jgi:hypothetical protein
MFLSFMLILMCYTRFIVTMQAKVGLSLASRSMLFKNQSMLFFIIEKSTKILNF